MSAWWVDRVLPGLVAGALSAGPGFVIHHVLMRRHVTRTADRQTADLRRGGSGKG